MPCIVTLHCGSDTKSHFRPGPAWPALSKQYGRGDPLASDADAGEIAAAPATNANAIIELPTNEEMKSLVMSISLDFIQPTAIQYEDSI